MAQYLKILSLAVASCGGLLAQSATGDAARGEQVLRDRGCINCHKVNGEGGNRARISAYGSPATIRPPAWLACCGAMILPRGRKPACGQRGHSPSMPGNRPTFSLTSRLRGISSLWPMPEGVSRSSERSNARVATASGSALPRMRLPSSRWHSLRDPIGFALDTWNPQGMERALERKGVRYPRFTSQEMNDLLLYLDNLREIRSKKFQFQLADSEQGRNVFHSVQCDSCHQGKASLEERTERISLADIQAEIWNASTRLKTLPAVSRDEMSDLFAYLWSLEPRGDAHHGEIAFTKKKCATCHTGQGSSAPMLSERDLSPVSMVAALLSHGSAMQAELTKRSLAWPQIHETEISDMAAYLRDRHPSAANEVPYRAAALDILSSRYR